MTQIDLRPKNESAPDRPGPEADRVVALPHKGRKRRGYGGALFGGIALLLLLGGLAVGAWHHYQAVREAAATAQQIRTFIPSVRVAAVRDSGASCECNRAGTNATTRATRATRACMTSRQAWTSKA